MFEHKREIEMTGEHLLKNMLLFAYPLIISNLFQRLYNMADQVIVGRFSGAQALAAVGGTAPVVSLFTWGLMGFSIGADVVVSKSIGEKDPDRVHDAVHTAYCLACIAGLTTVLLGFLFSRSILVAMGIPSDILPWSLLYIRIYFLGLFFTVVYNFGAAIIRSSGDANRPMMYLMATGFMNVVLNLIFVVIFRLGVAGVAIATALSQITAAVLVTRSLMKDPGMIRLEPAKIRLDGKIALQIIAIGLPSLFQNGLFSASNIVVQSAINSFGAITIAANSAATTLEEFVYISTGAVNQVCVTFTGQNNGAGKVRNVRRVMFRCIMLTCLMGFCIGLIINLNGSLFLGLFAKEAEVVTAGLIRLRIVAFWLFLNGVSDILAGSLRGMGYSLLPMITILTGVCGYRLIHIFTIFRAHPSLEVLYLCYPISWIIVIVVLGFLWAGLYRRFCRMKEERKEENA